MSFQPSAAAAHMRATCLAGWGGGVEVFVQTGGQLGRVARGSAAARTFLCQPWSCGVLSAAAGPWMRVCLSFVGTGGACMRARRVPTLHLLSAHQCAITDFMRHVGQVHRPRSGLHPPQQLAPWRQRCRRLGAAAATLGDASVCAVGSGAPKKLITAWQQDWRVHLRIGARSFLRERGLTSLHACLHYADGQLRTRADLFTEQSSCESGGHTMCVPMDPPAAGGCGCV